MNHHKKKILRESLAAVAIVIIVMVGYSYMMKSQEELLTQDSGTIASLPPKTASPQMTKTAASSATDYCSTLTVANFRSVVPGVNGYMTFALSNGSLSWNHVDFVETGSYYCSKNVLQIKLLNKALVSATYSGTAQTFTWEGVQYKRY